MCTCKRIVYASVSFTGSLILIGFMVGLFYIQEIVCDKDIVCGLGYMMGPPLFCFCLFACCMFWFDLYVSRQENEKSDLP